MINQTRNFDSKLESQKTKTERISKIKLKKNWPHYLFSRAKNQSPKKFCCQGWNRTNYLCLLLSLTNALPMRHLTMCRLSVLSTCSSFLLEDFAQVFMVRYHF